MPAAHASRWPAPAVTSRKPRAVRSRAVARLAARRATRLTLLPPVNRARRQAAHPPLQPAGLCLGSQVIGT